MLWTNLDSSENKDSLARAVVVLNIQDQKQRIHNRTRIKLVNIDFQCLTPICKRSSIRRLGYVSFIGLHVPHILPETVGPCWIND